MEMEHKDNGVWTFTANYGMPSSSLEAKKAITWPSAAFFRGRTK